MSFVDRLLNNLFSKHDSESNPLRKVLIKEMIKRESQFIEAYENWKKKDAQLVLLEEIQSNRLQRQAEVNAPINYFEHRERMSNGFYVRAEKGRIAKEYAFLIHYFIEKLKGLEYHISNSTREVIEEDGELKTLEQFYLKPKLKFRRELPYAQLFGNVIIEHQMVGDQTSLVKLMTNVYSDRNFKKPYHFDDLMNELLLL